MTEFVLSKVKVAHGGELRVGDLIEHPFRSGHAWRIAEIDEKEDRITLGEAEGLPVKRPGRASLPEEPR